MVTKKKNAVRTKRLTKGQRQDLMNESPKIPAKELATKYNVTENTVRVYLKRGKAMRRQERILSTTPNATTRKATAKNIEVTHEGGNVVVKVTMPVGEFFKSTFAGLLA